MKQWLVWILAAVVPVAAFGDETPPAPAAAAPAATAPAAVADVAENSAAGLRRLSPKDELWIDVTRKLVVIDGQVALREGSLEMFACPKGTKEHESVVSLNCKASFVHAALLAVGAKSGHPVRFDPEYRPATGAIVDIWVLWQDESGNRHKLRAQEWVRSTKTKAPLQDSWVFGGSSFWTDETTGERFYSAESGDLICVSNFTTATLDLPVPSSQTNDDLVFEAATEKIPPKGTKVRLVLVPRVPREPAASGAPQAAP